MARVGEPKWLQVGRPTRMESAEHPRVGGGLWVPHEEKIMASQTLTALYNDPVTAEAAIERLRAIGIPEASLEMHPATDGDIAPGNAPSGGLFGLGDQADERGIAGAGTVVVALHVPDDLVTEAAGILDKDAIEVEKDRDSE